MAASQLGRLIADRVSRAIELVCGLSVAEKEFRTVKFVPLTPEHFERARATLDAAEEEIKATRVKLGEFEQRIAHFVASLEPVGPAAPEVRSLAESTKPRENRSLAPRASAPKKNRPYTPEQIETLRTASRADLAHLAKDWGRTHDGLEKKREELRAIARREAEPDPVAEPAPEEPASDPVAKPTLEEPISARHNHRQVLRPEQPDERNLADVFDNTSGHDWASRSIRSRLSPGKPVSGLIDNGPGDRRELDPATFSSKNTG